MSAVADTDYTLAKRKADEFHIGKCYATADKLLADPDIRIVHNCTPNHLHAEINEKVLRAGKHLFSEKPLARTFEEAQRLRCLAAEHKDLCTGVNFNYRMNPLVQEMRAKVRSGEIGKPWLIHGCYLQDWLMYDTDYNWRIEPEISGPSRCIADIGSHWMDAAQYILDAKITEVSADLGVVFERRKKPRGQVETFSVSESLEYEEKEVKTEDYGSVMFRMDNGVRGVYHTSEVSAGHGCYFQIELNGSKASVQWNQESADHMWMGFRDQDNLHIIRNPATLSPEAAKFAHLAKGHPEGWNDAFKNSIESFYRFVGHNMKIGRDTCDFATFDDAAYIIALTRAILKSHNERRWITVETI